MPRARAISTSCAISLPTARTSTSRCPPKPVLRSEIRSPLGEALKHGHPPVASYLRTQGARRLAAQALTMLVDAAQLTENSRLEADVVIAGGGVAGITLARQLADTGLSVLVLESGGEQPEPRTQSLYEGTMTLGGPGNDPRPLNDYLVSSRVRCFGGSGNVWGGKCAPLDPVDFQKRDWIRHSGWPIDRAGLQPFYDRACALLELPRFGEQATSVVGPDEPLLAGRASSLAIRPRCYTRYHRRGARRCYAGFKRSATSHARVSVCLHANVTAIKLDERGHRVESLEVQELDGRKHSAVGRAYVLATGGIENVRLLLASNDVQRDGIGNHSDWLGRGFQGHTTISQERGHVHVAAARRRRSSACSTTSSASGRTL